MAPPTFKTVAWVRLGPQHLPTGRLDFNAVPVNGPQAEALLLLTSDTDGRCYLYYCQADGTAINDSLHENIDEAMRTAEVGFGVQTADWQWSPWPEKKVWSILLWTAEEGAVDTNKAQKEPRRRRRRN